MSIDDNYCVFSTNEMPNMNLVTLYKRSEVTKFELLFIIKFFTDINQPLSVPDFVRICYIFKNLGRLCAISDDFVMKKNIIKSRTIKELLKLFIINDLITRKGCRLYCYLTLPDLEKLIYFLDNNTRLKVINVLINFLHNIYNIPYSKRISFSNYLFRNFNNVEFSFDPIFEQENIGIMNQLINSIIVVEHLDLFKTSDKFSLKKYFLKVINILNYIKNKIFSYFKQFI
jgi:hypothetical protein